jgi:hypothetical protein
MLQDVTLLCTRARERTYLSFSNSFIFHKSASYFFLSILLQETSLRIFSYVAKKGETIVLGDLTYLYMVSHTYLHKLNILFTSHLFLLGLIEVSCNNILRKKYEADLWKINELLNDK